MKIKKINMKNKKMKKGSMITEYMLYIGLIAIALIGIFIWYSSTKADQKVLTEKQNLTSIRSSIESLYAGSSSYSGITAQNLIKVGAIPNTMINSNGNSIINSFGGSVTVVSGTKYSAAKGYTIIYSSIPSKECSKMLIGLASTFDEIGVGASGSLKTGLARVDVNPSTIITACNNISNALYFGVYE